MTSMHYTETRSRREMRIKKLGDGNVIEGFVVDRGHKNGPEVHSITDKGIILVYNYYSGKLVTKLIARPGQIRRYYTAAGKEAPKWLLDVCKEHTKMGLNVD